MDLHLGDLVPKFLRSGEDSGDLIGLEFGASGLSIAYSSRHKQKNTGQIIKFCDFHPESSIDKQLVYLKKLVSSRRWHSKPCNVVLHTSKYQVSTIEAPDVSEAELRQAVHWKLFDLFGRSPDELAFDAIFLSKDAYRTPMVLVSAIPRSLMAKIARDISDAGLTLKSISLQEFALHNIAISAIKQAGPVALLSLNKSNAMLSVSADGKACFSRAFDKGLNAFGQLQIDGEQQNTRDDFILDLQRSLDFFESQLRKGRPPQLYVLPTAPEIESVIESMSSGLALPVLSFPFSKLVPDGACDLSALMQCTNAMGAALWRNGA